ncbi:MAG TPA: DUF1259 domain-containing protein [Thermoanaerobaculia bacterium]|nr:DUF1259 domain-containing protein [Thermoanaerobaculia bacterium]
MICPLLALLLLATPAAGQSAGRPDPASIEKLTGAKGAWNEKEGVFKVSVPRADLAVTARGARITPALGLTSWAAFSGSGAHSMVMGDMVLTEDQVSPVMRVALDGGLEVTGLHNHFLGETPRVMFLHVGGAGEEAALAATIGKVFATIREMSPARTGFREPSIDPASTSLDSAKLDALLGQKGELKDGVYKIVVGRTVRVHGADAGAAMGVNTWAAFAGSDAHAVVDGDFATLASELQPVLKALTGAGIDVVAIHNHMTGEEPRIVFLHYWGIGRAEDLARGVRGALDRVKGS